MNNNNEQFENFIRDFDKIRMTHSEKNKIQNNLRLFVQEQFEKQKKQKSPYFFSYTSIFKKTLSFTLALFLLISVSKSVSAKALPGEFLYNVKIIHEEIEAANIRNPEDKVDFEIKRTEKRIREAVQLAKSKKLDKSKQKKIAEKIKEHVEHVSKQIEDIKKEDPEKALSLNSELKTTLKVNSEALKVVTKKKKITAKKTRIKKQKQKKEKNENTKETNATKNEIKSELNNNIQPTKTITENKIVTHEIVESLPSEDKIKVEKVQKGVDESKINEKTLPIELTTQEKTKGGEGNSMLNKQNNEIVDEPETKKEMVTTDTEEESFADIILESINYDIEKTETINNVIEDEITKKEENAENIQKQDQDSVENVEQNNDETLITSIAKQNDSEDDEKNKTKVVEQTLSDKNTITNNINEDSSNDDEHVNRNDNIIIPSQKRQEPMGIEQLGYNNVEIYKDETESGIAPTVTKNTEPLIEEKINTIETLQLDITSIKQIISAEEKLNSLLSELSLERNKENKDTIQKLIEEEKFGMAYVQVQNEIEALSEIKLKRELGRELGIHIDTEVKNDMEYDDKNIIGNENEDFIPHVSSLIKKP